MNEEVHRGELVNVWCCGCEEIRETMEKLELEISTIGKWLKMLVGKEGQRMVAMESSECKIQPFHILHGLRYNIHQGTFSQSVD